MKGKVKQTLSALSAEYDIILESKNIGSIKIPDNRILSSIYYYNTKNEEYVFKWDGANSIKNLVPRRKTKEYVKYVLFKNETPLLRISSKKTNGIFGYSYYEIVFNEEIIYVYVIGMGKDGRKIVFETDKKCVALIEKENTVINNLDEYDIYAEDKYFNFAVIFIGYYDLITFSNAGQVDIRAKNTRYFVTTNKELRSKYDKNFKNQF